MELETQRLLLRQPRAEDVDDYLAFRNSPFVLRYNAMKEQTKEEAIARFSAGEKEQWDTLVMEHKATGRVIGAIFTEEDSLRWGIASKELSYFLREDCARQGYMKEALRAVIEYLFRMEKLECVAARAFAPNTASRTLLRSLGFHQDGYIPRCVKGYGDVVFDDTLHSLLREEYHRG